MKYVKFSTLQQQVMDDQDLNEETFIQPTSFLNYFNEAITFIESKIHTLYEDYFMTFSEQNATAGADTLQMPANIYANKIRKIFWKGGDRGDRYEIKRIRNLQDTQFAIETDRYRYLPVNSAVTTESTPGTQFKLYPPLRETTTGLEIKMFFLRSANRYVDDTSVCDVPEFSDVVKQYVVYKCKKKEGHPMLDTERNDLDTMIVAMIETLKERMPDENNEILKDMSFYEDFDPYYSLF